MGDSRFHLKGKFEIYGKEFPFDFSLNWFDEDETGVDHRISAFFRDSYRIAKEAYDDADLDYQAQKSAKEREALEAKERLILAELKKKYEP